MVRLAIQDNRAFCISDFEIKRKQRSYTIETVRYFKKKWPRPTKLFFVIGGDMLPGLNKWKDIEQISRIVSFIVVNRPGNTNLNETTPQRTIKFPGIDVSSSYIRHCLLEGKSIKYLVPEQVLAYIQRHRLLKSQLKRS